MREEHRIRILENKVLRKILGFRRKEETGEWRRLQKEEFYDHCVYQTFILSNQECRLEWSMWKCGRHDRFIQGIGGET